MKNTAFYELIQLSEDIGLSNVIIPVYSTSSFLYDSGFILIGQERVRYSFKPASGDTFGDATHPCIRGYCGTSQSGHLVNTDVYNLWYTEQMSVKTDLLPADQLDLNWKVYE